MKSQIDTVLVVDDDDNWCFVTKILLEDSEMGNNILTANNGEEAIIELEAIVGNGQKLPELIFLDLKMPVMDGFEFLEEVTTSGKFDLSQTKIYISTSSFLPRDKERAKLYPIAGFITKPITEEILKKIVYETEAFL